MQQQKLATAVLTDSRDFVVR